ncbi:HAMP domain-containing sensor histidine kinase [Stigmatella sp. ncwal1]|uniref:histidine kinase n=1 Tax=Stigmatella ashevillensis TaxID=2995309 RepID=A0ABT5D8X0_9BACT|nr:HAMP domain-containing sensor histidine kinase [Stigmatella ashevillena]MDC0709278.1 HAMP domain-containing sensor histidine kinase [Stigmatella ashevillena]
MNALLLQAVQLAWSPGLRVTRVEGDSATVLRRPAAELLDTPLHVALGISPERARDLNALAQEDRHAVEFLSAQLGSVEPSSLRLVLGLSEGAPAAAILDLNALLIGAPPVQISGLSSSLSHEIRNPLSSVKMAVQTLQRNTGLSDRDKRRLTIANREIRTMERMLWMLSEYGRDSVPNLDSHPLRSVLQEAQTMVAPELAERRIELNIEEEPELPRARVDTLRLRPVLAQLLLNIAMGQPEGSQVQVHLRTGPSGQAQLLLKDPVAALPPEERATLFEPFGSRLAHGAGLSLAALRRVMLNQGGTVSAEGSAEPGMVFTLTFAV